MVSDKIRDGETVLLADVGDVDTLTNHVERLTAIQFSIINSHPKHLRGHALLVDRVARLYYASLYVWNSNGTCYSKRAFGGNHLRHTPHQASGRHGHESFWFTTSWFIWFFSLIQEHISIPLCLDLLKSYSTSENKTACHPCSSDQRVWRKKGTDLLTENLRWQIRWIIRSISLHGS